MKRLFFPVILAIILIGILLSGLSDTAISVEDTAGPNSKVASSLSQASNSSASTTITITMYTVDDE